MLNFYNKIVLITGSAGEVGSSLAINFAKNGARLILVEHNEKNQLKLLKKIKKNKNYNSKYSPSSYICDLEKEEQRNKMIEEIYSKFNKIDVLINNAALVGTSDLKGWNTKFRNQNLDTWKRAIEVNLTAPFHLILSLQSLLQKSSSPNIINIASIYGLLGANWSLYKDSKNIGNPAAYAVSKGGLIQMSKWLSTALAPKIRVNSISPGGIKRNQPKKFVDLYESMTPLNKMLDIKDVTDAVLYLTSKNAKNITGHNLIIDGGWSAH